MKDESDGLASAFVIIFGLTCVASWCMNIYKLCFVDSVVGLVVARAIGIFLFPLGVALGFF